MTSIRMHSIEMRFVILLVILLIVILLIVPSNIQFAGVSTFQPGNFTGCGNEGVNLPVVEVKAERMHEIV